MIFNRYTGPRRTPPRVNLAPNPSRFRITSPRVRSMSDHEMLVMLDLCDRQGLSCDKAAKILNDQFGNNRTRNAVIGAMHRIKADCAKVSDLTRHPENRNGGMPDFWWQDGIAKQEELANGV